MTRYFGRQNESHIVRILNRDGRFVKFSPYASNILLNSRIAILKEAKQVLREEMHAVEALFDSRNYESFTLLNRSLV